MTNTKTVIIAILATLAAPALAQQPAPGSTMPMAPGHAMPNPTMPNPTMPNPTMPDRTMPGHTMPGHTMPGMAAPAADASPSTKAFKAADEKMMTDMNRPMTGNADQDFVAGMLPHHNGAVDMARVEIQYGKDPEMLRLARGIIAAQEKEIAQMKEWQRKHPKP